MGSPSKPIRTDRPFPIPPHVRQAIDTLARAGYSAYVVGGSVRDFLLGREAKDHDLATDASPDELVRLFPDALTVGKAFGVLKVPSSVATVWLEIATFRQDLAYEDHRHPTAVRFGDPLEDARRRDFTINALFFDPRRGQILDLTEQGLADLEGGVVRAIGRPAERFREDALRLLRAVRFATRLGFRIEEQTAQAIQARARLITRVSAERIRDELTAMWRSPEPGAAGAALGGLSELGLLEHVLPEVQALRGSPAPPPHAGQAVELLGLTGKVMDRVAERNPERSAALAWAAVLHDVGRPVSARPSGGANSNGFEIEGARLAVAIGERLKFPRQEIDRIASLVGEQRKFREVFQMRESTLERFIRQPGFVEHLALHRAIASVADGNLAFHEFCLARWQAWQAAGGGAAESRLIEGKDLVQLGLVPGPEFSRILRAVEDLALEKRLTTKDQALEYVIRHFVR